MTSLARGIDGMRRAQPKRQSREPRGMLSFNNGGCNCFCPTRIPRAPDVPRCSNKAKRARNDAGAFGFHYEDRNQSRTTTCRSR